MRVIIGASGYNGQAPRRNFCGCEGRTFLLDFNQKRIFFPFSIKIFNFDFATNVMVFLQNKFSPTIYLQNIRRDFIILTCPMYPCTQTEKSIFLRLTFIPKLLIQVKVLQLKNSGIYFIFFRINLQCVLYIRLLVYFVKFEARYFYY